MNPDPSPLTRANARRRSRRHQARLIQMWLAAMVVGTAAAVLQLHLWPPRPSASLPSLASLPGQPLPAWTGQNSPSRAASPILRRRLAQNRELRLTALVDTATQPFQVALHSRTLVTLHLQQRRLLQRPGGEVAVGLLQRQPAAQTCLSGSGHGISAAALGRLQVAPATDPRSRLLRLLGWQRHPPRQCLLVTLVAGQPAGPWRTSDQEQLIRRLEAIVADLHPDRPEPARTPEPGSASSQTSGPA